MFDVVIHFFQTGGLFMYPIMLVLALGGAIAVERYLYLERAKGHNRKDWGRLQPILEQGKYKEALKVSDGSNTALAKVLGYGLSRVSTARHREDIELAMEEGLMEVIPQLEQRTHYLATLANIATLLGLLGTIIGLIEAFTAVAAANPAEKADLLSASISVAMNTTAFGLIVGIPLLLAHAFLQTKTTELVDSLEMAAVRLVNVITLRAGRRRNKTRVQPGPNETQGIQI